MPYCYGLCSASGKAELKWFLPLALLAEGIKVCVCMKGLLLPAGQGADQGALSQAAYSCILTLSLIEFEAKFF